MTVLFQQNENFSMTATEAKRTRLVKKITCTGLLNIVVTIRVTLFFR